MNSGERFIAGAAVAAAFVAGAALEARIGGFQIVIDNRVPVHGTLPVGEVEAATGLLKKSTPELVQKALVRYASTDSNLKRLFSSQIAVDEKEVFGKFDKNVTAQIDEKAKEHIIFGATVLKATKLALEDQVQIKGYDDVEIDGLKFDLNDGYQRQVAGALINTILQPTDYGPNNRTTPAELETNVKDLKWLYTNYKNIVFEPGAFAIIPEDYLVNTSKVLQELRRNNFPLPKEIRFVPYSKTDDNGGSYRGAPLFKIHITNHSDPRTSIYHEVGHFISDVSVMQDPNASRLAPYSQAEFDKIFERMKSQLKTDKKLHDQKNTHEEFAEMFRMYVSAGYYLRTNVIATTLKYEPERGAVMIAEYQFMKDLFGGVEFSRPFEVVEHLDPNIALSSGNVLSISDVSITHPGVLLRPTPSLAKDPEYPLVHDGDTVRIVSGPQMIIDSDGKKVEMWRVERVYAYSRDRYEPSSKDTRGWMSREWFGKVLK